MCTRIIQFRKDSDYIGALGCEDVVTGRVLSPEVRSYNLAPGASLRVIRRHEGGLALQRARWGYIPPRRKNSGKPITRARVETAATSRGLAALWSDGRCIVPADGWYEWQGEGARAQPFRIRLPQDAPLFIAAVADVSACGEEPAGLLLITAQLGFGLLDSHDERPVVLTAEDACTWLDSATSPDVARQLAAELLLPAPAFEWYPVTPAVHDPHFDRAEALDEIAMPA